MPGELRLDARVPAAGPLEGAMPVGYMHGPAGRHLGFDPEHRIPLLHSRSWGPEAADSLLPPDEADKGTVRAVSPAEVWRLYGGARPRWERAVRGASGSDGLPEAVSADGADRRASAVERLASWAIRSLLARATASILAASCVRADTIVGAPSPIIRAGRVTCPRTRRRGTLLVRGSRPGKMGRLSPRRWSR